MSPRSRYPQPRLSTSHYFISLARGDRMHTLALRPWFLHGLGVASLGCLLLCLAAGGYLFFRGDMVTALIMRQAEMQQAYEDRLAAMRVQMDRVTSRQLLDQNTIEGRVHDLLSRQAQLENRASIISSLAEQAGVIGDFTSSVSPAGRSDAKTPPQQPRLNPLLASPPAAQRAPNLPAEASAFAPVVVPAMPAAAPKPRPEALELRGELHPADPVTVAVASNPDIPVPIRLGTLSSGLERMELAQVRVVEKISAAARQRAGRLKSLIAELGLSADRLSVPNARKQSVGGPFIPLPTDGRGTLFEQELGRAQSDFVAASRLNELVAYLPLRRPLPGDPEITSGFGVRIDPFLGRRALHSGLDLRDDYGSPVRVTAAGTVSSAGWAGGYGNMVEVDHGNGLTTRYGHLASISVEEGQTITAGAIVGKLGSTGRSTGPHLHYEVRIDGEPVDPMRFVKASYKAAALN